MRNPSFSIRLLMAMAVCFPVLACGEESLADSAPASADGVIVLKADAARIHGFHLKLQRKPEPTIMFWIDPNEYVEWPKAVNKGKYEVEVTYSCAPNAGGEFAVVAAANRVTAHTQTTKDWNTFTTQKVGVLRVLNDHTNLALRSTGSINHVLMNVREVKLTPVKEKKK